jgi:1,4-dihydroxy-2-naphthoate octaprenyltransferase
VEYPELEHTALKIAVFLLGLSVIGNALFTVVYAYPLCFFIFVFLGSLIGWFYTPPPLKLVFRGLCELVIVLAIGVFIPGMGYFVASGALDYLFYMFIFPLAFLWTFFHSNS